MTTPDCDTLVIGAGSAGCVLAARITRERAVVKEIVQLTGLKAE